jgi:hypothetical protein
VEVPTESAYIEKKGEDAVCGGSTEYEWEEAAEDGPGYPCH